MAAGSEATKSPPELSLSITRIFDAPRHLVYAAFTKGEHLRNWCAPRGFTITHGEGEVRPGGKLRCCIRSPEGVDHWVNWNYSEVVENQRLIFTHQWDEPDGKPGHETVVTVTFTDEGKKTKMAFHQATFKSKQSRDGHEGGWTESFDRLGEYVKML